MVRRRELQDLLHGISDVSRCIDFLATPKEKGKKSMQSKFHPNHRNQKPPRHLASYQFNSFRGSAPHCSRAFQLHHEGSNIRAAANALVGDGYCTHNTEGNTPMPHQQHPERPHHEYPSSRAMVAGRTCRVEDRIHYPCRADHSGGHGARRDVARDPSGDAIPVAADGLQVRREHLVDRVRRAHCRSRRSRRAADQGSDRH